MQKIKSLSSQRLIVQAIINGKQANMLVDTGATVGLLSRSAEKKLMLQRGKRFGKPLVGAGGEFYAYCCNSFAQLGGKTITQFLIADIDSVVRSVKQQTGIEIQGIISLPQMQFIGMQIDANDHLIIIE